ncbi:hypothetical protein EMIT048CA2_30431 [Pseudomonas chlororaphis]
MKTVYRRLSPLWGRHVFKSLKGAILTEPRGKSEALCVASFYNSGAFWPDSKGGAKKRPGGNENPGSVFTLLVV